MPFLHKQIIVVVVYIIMLIPLLLANTVVKLAAEATQQQQQQFFFINNHHHRQQEWVLLQSAYSHIYSTHNSYFFLFFTFLQTHHRLVKVGPENNNASPDLTRRWHVDLLYFELGRCSKDLCLQISLLIYLQVTRGSKLKVIGIRKASSSITKI